jgi:hypothetical protein
MSSVCTAPERLQKRLFHNEKSIPYFDSKVQRSGEKRPFGEQNGRTAAQWVRRGRAIDRQTLGKIDRGPSTEN